MAKGLRQPALNPVRFVKRDYTFPDQSWGYPAFGEAVHKDWLKDKFRMFEDWEQPFTRDMTICFEIHRGYVNGGGNILIQNPTELYIYDENGTFIKYLSPTYNNTISGVVDKDSGEQFITQQFKFKISEHSELNTVKKITLALRLYYGDSTNEFWIAQHRINVIDKTKEVDKTVLLRYANTANNYDVYFEQTKSYFEMLVPSYGLEYETGGEYISFKNQNQETQGIYGQSTNMAKWDIGGRYGVPATIIDIIDSALDCNRLRIDSRQYVRDSKEMSRKSAEGKILQNRECMLQDTNGNISFESFEPVVTLFTAPAPPYAVANLLLDDGVKTIFLTNANGHILNVIDDATAETNFITALNSKITAEGYNGVVSKLGSDIVLTNADGERLTLFILPDVFSKVLTLTVNVSATNTTFRYFLDYIGANREYHVVSWGSSSGDDDLRLSGVQFFGSTVINNITTTKFYATTGNKTVRIFHRDREVGFVATPITTGSTRPRITNITGNISSRTTDVQLNLHNLGSFSLAWLGAAKASLQSLRLDNNDITSIQDNWASAFISGGVKPYSRLRYISIDGNALTSARVDAFFNEMVASMQYVGGSGYVSLRGGTTAAPTGTSLTARNTLINAFWSVLTN